MKRTNFLCALFALAVLSVSCSRTEPGQLPRTAESSARDPFSVDFKWWAITPLEGHEAPTGDPSTLRAGFSADSRTFLEMNGTESEAAVVWNAGDSFIMVGLNGNSYRYAYYTTTTGGASAEFTTSYTNLYTPCYSIYPDVTKLGTYKNPDTQEVLTLFDVNIPHEQEAVEGNIAPGVNIAYAYSESQTADLRFRNMVSLVRFRLSGGIAGEIKQVTLKGSQILSGDVVILTTNGNDAAINTDWGFSGDEKYSSVILSGDFRAGVDYYIAVVPTSPQLITMVFENGSGDSVTKYGTNDVQFQQGRICDLGTIALGDSYDEDDPTLDPILYMASSKPYPVTIAVIPDGFTAEELSVYEAQAKGGINALFATEPYKTYRDYFNVWILKVASNGSGANITDGNGNVITATGCYFNSGWGESSYSDMSANENTVFSFVSENCPDIINGDRRISEVPILIIINDSRYGGICHSYSSGKCYAMVPTTPGNLAWSYPSHCAISDEDPSLGTRDVTDEEKAELGFNSGDWRNTLVHEFGGHGFGRLSDEYWYTTDKGATSSISGHFWPVPMGLNISASYGSTPWDEEVLSLREELVAKNPLYARIGVFQGGDVSILNRWRSEKTSCMIDNRFFFSTWQRMLIVKRILSLAGEDFDLETFYALDHPEDPVRDAVANPVQGLQSPLPPILVPPGAPMKLIVDD